MKHVLEISADFYRMLMVVLCDGEPQTRGVLVDVARQAASQWQTGHEGAAVCLERCLEAIEQVDANANQATLLECWIDDLQQIAQRGTLQPV